MKTIKAETIIIGGGIAGITSAIELIEKGKSVAIIERDKHENFGGLAKESFGGMFYINSPQQKKLGIKDNIELAKKDWFSFAEYSETEYYGKKWAEEFLENTDKIYKWVTERKVGYFPVVHWVERGLFVPGNSVPRFHMVWGTGYGLIDALIKYIENHPNRKLLQLHFEHRVEQFKMQNEKVISIEGKTEVENEEFEAIGQQFIIASGGINGNMKKVKENWHKEWGTAPEKILNGSHHYSDGLIHDEIQKIGGQITNLDLMWNYAAGIPHPNPKRPNHGLSIVPPKSAIWVNSKGKRMGPVPLVTAFDTRYMVTKICEEEKKYSWQILNSKIAKKELAVSGSEFNDAIKNKKLFAFALSLFFGNKSLLSTLENKSEDYILAYSIEELAEKMNKLTGDNEIDVETLKKSIEGYDQNYERGKNIWNDEQIRRIQHTRQYRGDKIRTCKNQKINDKKAYPLIAIREYILSRKSLGGIQTNLDSQVLMQNTNPKEAKAFANLYAVGEAAGFGGGGSHGKRALEGTFLATCIFTAQKAVKHITKVK
ncbi:MAG: FAD-binding dehydrogenase [Bacteroidales bacterium]|nr:FAD-binding dehydrogenase [Bacteroidales bacterium]